jgi:hypothetical protein
LIVAIKLILRFGSRSESIARATDAAPGFTANRKEVKIMAKKEKEQRETKKADRGKKEK